VPCCVERAGDPFRSVGRVCRRCVDFNATPGGDWMMACHAVRLLASAPKDRTSSEHADWVAVKVALGEAEFVKVSETSGC
jgi:methylphosphotriester-DNA--protein-cysteine methyltransferase